MRNIEANAATDLERIEDTHLAPLQRLGVCPGPPRSRHHEGIRCARDLLWKTPVRENGKGSQENYQGQVWPHEEGRRVCIGSILDSMQFWKKQRLPEVLEPKSPHQQSPPQEPACLPHQLCHSQSSTRNGLWSLAFDANVMMELRVHRPGPRSVMPAQSVLLHGHTNSPVFFTRPHPVPISPTYFQSTWISSASLPWSIVVEYPVPLNLHSISPLLSLYNWILSILSYFLVIFSILWLCVCYMQHTQIQLIPENMIL